MSCSGGGGGSGYEPKLVDRYGPSPLDEIYGSEEFKKGYAEAMQKEQAEVITELLRELKAWRKLAFIMMLAFSAAFTGFLWELFVVGKVNL